MFRLYKRTSNLKIFLISINLINTEINKLQWKLKIL
jgi:hypothetical protein